MKPRLQAVKKQLLVQKRLIELHGHCGWGETCRAISYAQEQQVISDSDAMQLWTVLQDGTNKKRKRGPAQPAAIREAVRLVSVDFGLIRPDSA